MNKVPAFLAHRPTAHGLPVPYFVALVDGKPDFRTLDANKQRICTTYGKCNICGGIGAVDYVICGPEGLRNRIDSHAPSHKHCAEYALANCPFLSIQATSRRTDYPEGAVAITGAVDEKPTELYLVQIDRLLKVVTSCGWLFNFRPVRELRYHFVNGRLVEAGEGWQKVELGLPWRQEGARKL